MSLDNVVVFSVHFVFKILIFSYLATAVQCSVLFYGGSCLTEALVLHGNHGPWWEIIYKILIKLCRDFSYMICRDFKITEFMLHEQFRDNPLWRVGPNSRAPSGASILNSGRQCCFQRASGAWRVPRKIPAPVRNFIVTPSIH